MSTILITGAAGFLGSLLVKELITDPGTPDVRLILADVVKPRTPSGIEESRVASLQVDLTDDTQLSGLFKTHLGVPQVIYSLHGIMSKGAEENFDLGFRVNVDATRALLELARHAQSAQPIRFIFTSSLAPDVITPKTAPTPENSYGAAKHIGEVLVNEYTRRGFVDGRVIRLPTIAVRPGPPAPATTAFISGIIREPLHGLEAFCPIGDSFDSPELDKLAVWIASPSTTIKNFVIASRIPAGRFPKHSRIINLPGFTVTIRQELEALRDIAGQEALDRVKYRDDPISRQIVSSFPASFDNSHALSLGFVQDQGGFAEVVREFQAGMKGV